MAQYNANNYSNNTKAVTIIEITTQTRLVKHVFYYVCIQEAVKTLPKPTFCKHYLFNY